MELDGESDLEHNRVVDIGLDDDVDSLYGVDLDGNVDMEMDGDDEEEADEQEEDEQEEDEDADNGKEPWMIGQGAMVNTTADNVNTMVDNQPTMLPEQSQEIHEQTQQLQPLAPAPMPHTPEPCPQPPTPDTHPVSGLEILWRVIPLHPRPVAAILRKAEAAGNTSDINVEQ
jgi:hypothetical protein